jgi:hypothetical protein
MDASFNQQVVPPAWSSRFAEYFTDLKTWVDHSAYPALAQGPLKTDPIVTTIPAELARIQEDLTRSRPIPIALVGLTGVGKSTLLNALLEEEFLPVGVIGSQTAAFVTISYAPQWEVTCDYIEESELIRIFEEAGSEIDERTETGSPEARERAEKKVRALLRLKDDGALPERSELRAGPPLELREIVAQHRRRFSSDSNWKEELNLHAKGRLWPITKTIDVRGPFEMLQSGVVISDLPGAGDLNRARANQAAAAIKDAGQILIAADTKLLQTSLMDQLEGAGRLPHRLFMNSENVQLILVGTSLDKGLPDPEDDPGQVRELGLDPMAANLFDVFSAVCSEWSKAVRPVFATWLRTKALEFLPDSSEEARESRVQQILSRVVVVPTSAKDWVRYKRGKKMQVCRIPAETGLPELRLLINVLAEQQIATTVGALEHKIASFRDLVLASLDRSESTLGADIEGIVAAIDRSHQEMKEVQDRHVQVVEDLRLSVLERFQQVRETLGDKIQNAALKMREMGRKQVYTHLSDLHWASLRATVNNDGFWVTRHGRQVNLRDAMGGEMTRLVPQAWSRIADERVRKCIEEAKDHTLKALADFTAGVRKIVEAGLADDLSRHTVDCLFEASLNRAEIKIEQRSNGVLELLGQTSKDMQQRVDEAVDLSLEHVCGECSDDRGVGWRSRSVTRIVEGTEEVAEQSEKRCIEIADGVFQDLETSIASFCKEATTEVAKMGKDIPAVLKDAVERSRLSTPQSQYRILESARASAPPAPDLTVAVGRTS